MSDSRSISHRYTVMDTDHELSTPILAFLIRVIGANLWLVFWDNDLDETHQLVRMWKN